MSIVVTKFGGTSLATPDLIKNVAKKVQRLSRDNDVVVVVSAMGNTTDKLMAMSRAITLEPKARELDMLLTAGERISVALLSMALESLNLQAVSFTGSQVGIITDNKHTDARILEIKGDRLRKALTEHKVAVVCGFQGVSMEKEITTLGRGGSDTTALALSAALNAQKCIIYTDVDGVFTEDPNRFKDVKKINKISYDEMLELSYHGAQVLHPRASSIAAHFKIPVEIRNSFNNKTGTLITNLGNIEKPRPKAITHTSNLYLITLISVPKNPEHLYQIVTDLANGGIHLKFFFHGISRAKKLNLSFIIPFEEKELARSIFKRMRKKLSIREIKESADIASLSLIGQGIGSSSGVLTRTLNTLANIKIHIEAITTSELSINMFLKKKYLNQAARALLKTFNLMKKT